MEQLHTNQNTDFFSQLLSFYYNDPEAMELVQQAMDNDEPIRFFVLCDDDVIGALYIKGNQHRYVPDKEVIQELEKKTFIMKELTEPQDWGRPIYYLQKMIDNTIRFPGRGWIGYQTSHISLEILPSRK